LHLVGFLLTMNRIINPLNVELNLICHLLALLGAHHILHVSRIRVKQELFIMKSLFYYTEKPTTTQSRKTFKDNGWIVLNFPHL